MASILDRFCVFCLVHSCSCWPFCFFFASCFCAQNIFSSSSTSTKHAWPRPAQTKNNFSVEFTVVISKSTYFTVSPVNSMSLYNFADRNEVCVKYFREKQLKIFSEDFFFRRFIQLCSRALHCDTWSTKSARKVDAGDQTRALVGCFWSRGTMQEWNAWIRAGKSACLTALRPALLEL